MMSKKERKMYLKMKQQFLPFDFFEKEKIKPENLAHFDEPKNDNERLFNLQYEYYTGSPKALDSMFVLLMQIAPRLVNIEMHSTKRRYTQEQIDEMALDATCLFIGQVKENELVIKTSFIAYLRLQVIKVMNRTTKAQRLESYCIRNDINLFVLPENEKQTVKMRFEEELRGKE